MIFAPKESESGQGLLEYGMIIVLVAVVILVVLVLMGPSIAEMYDYIIEKLWGG